MFFALSFIVVLAALYFLVYDGVDTYSQYKSLKEFTPNSKKTETTNEKPRSLDFDFETLVTPDELSILI